MRAELEELQGTWDIVALEIEGATMGESAFRGSQIVVKGNAFTAVGMGDTYKGKLKVDAAKTPKTLDLAFEEGPEKGNKSLAITSSTGTPGGSALPSPPKTARARLPRRQAAASPSKH